MTTFYSLYTTVTKGEQLQMAFTSQNVTIPQGCTAEDKDICMATVLPDPPY